MPPSNPYSSPAEPILNHRKKRISKFGVAALLTGLIFCVVAWMGATQLMQVASPNFTEKMEDFPIVKHVWEFFTPDTGTVIVARVAANVQRTFLLIGLIGALIVVTGLTLLCRGFFPSKSSDV